MQRGNASFQIQQTEKKSEMRRLLLVVAAYPLAISLFASNASGQRYWMSYDMEDPITGFNGRYMYMEGYVFGTERWHWLEPVTIWVWCKDDKTSVLIDWDETLDIFEKYQKVVYRIDKTPAITERQWISSDNEITFFQRPISFLRRIANAEQLVVRTTPAGERIRTVTFNMYPEHTKSEISKLSERCHWRGPRIIADSRRLRHCNATQVCWSETGNGQVRTLPADIGPEDVQRTTAKPAITLVRHCSRDRLPVRQTRWEASGYAAAGAAFSRCVNLRML